MIKSKLHIIIFFILLAGISAYAQKVEANLDSTSIKIGSQFNLTLKTRVGKEAKVSFPEGQEFGRLEVLESYPVDTTDTDGMYELVKKYGLTQFDSGRYVIPPLPVIINNKKINTRELKIEVRDVPVDTLKQKMYDIKPVIAANSSFSQWWWIAGIIILCAITALGAWKYRKANKQVSLKQEKQYKISPIEKAHRELIDLERQNLLSRGEVKDYYSRLTDIARTYIEEATNIPAMESTTGEVINALREAMNGKKIGLGKDTLQQLENVLRTADMVKFAKSRPGSNEIAEDKEIVEKTIASIDKSLPQENPEDSFRAQYLLEIRQKKKQRQKKNIIIVAASLALFSVLAFTAVSLGREYLQDTILGHPTKDLLNSEWVKSEYGIPGVIIETPKVLKRIDVRNTLSEGAKKNIRSMQTFSYGSVYDNFYIMVSTMAYDKPVGNDLVRIADENLSGFSRDGAENIFVKNEEFITGKGITGLRAFGSMTLPDPITKKRGRVRYEALYFNLGGGLQQVLVLHREDDKYAAEITEKIKNSVELRIN